MELYAQILADIIKKGKIRTIFCDSDIDVSQIIELECYKILQEVKAVLEDDEIDDEACFYRIERIVGVLEKHGIDAGNRHDFG